MPRPAVLRRAGTRVRAAECRNDLLDEEPERRQQRGHGRELPHQGHHRAPREDRHQHGHGHHLLAFMSPSRKEKERLERLLRGGAEAPAKELATAWCAGRATLKVIMGLRNNDTASPDRLRRPITPRRSPVAANYGGMNAFGGETVLLIAAPTGIAPRGSGRLHPASHLPVWKAARAPLC